MIREIDFKHLLPLKGIDIRLRCLSSFECPPFHYPVISAWLRYLLDLGDDYSKYFCIGLAESGKTIFSKGDDYHLRIILLSPPDSLLEHLFSQLQRLPDSFTHISDGPFGRNMQLIAINDCFSLMPVTLPEQLSSFDEARLNTIAESLQPIERFVWRWDSFVRLRKPQKKHQKLSGDHRFCRDNHDFSTSLLLERVFSSLADLTNKHHHGERPTLGDIPDLRLVNCHSFWMDNTYQNENGQLKPIGGAYGELQFEGTLDITWWRYIILLHWLGMGQSRVFGLGRFSLLTPDGTPILRHPLQPALRWSHMLHREHYIDNALSKSTGTVHEPLPDKPQLRKMVTALLQRTYVVPDLQGSILQQEGKAPRALASPPLADRVLQRIVLQVIQHSTERFFYDGSYGYRPAHSRQQARDHIVSLVQAGYRWVFESDIEDFFDTLDREKLALRLRCLLNDDCLTDYLLAWMSAPVIYQGEKIIRKNGIPQGSPLSPLLANLMLDDFDNDLKLQGFKLVRFADDFIIMCKSEARAKEARQQAERSLKEHGLSLNPHKTRITEIDRSIQFLGYLFVNDMVWDNPRKATAKDLSVPPHSWLATYYERQKSNQAVLSQPVTETGHALEDSTLIPVESCHNTSVDEQEIDNNCDLIEDDNALYSDDADEHDTVTDDTEPEVIPDNQMPSDSSNSLLTPELTTTGHRDSRGTGIYISGDPCIIRTYRNHIIVQRGDRILTDTPWTAVSHIILFGHHQLTSQAIHQACENSIAIHHATGMGRYIGVTASPELTSANQQLPQQQQQLDDERRLWISRALVIARIRSCREVLRRRHRPEQHELKRYQQQAETAANLMQLRGYEGSATRLYFGALQEILPDWAGFSGRNRLPPQDPFNALLSLGYTLIYGYTDSLLRASHLLSWSGIYHQPGGRHAALASDMMEPFRYLVERTALTLVNKKILTENDFEIQPEGVKLKTAGRQRYLSALLHELTYQTKTISSQADSLFEQLHKQIHSLITTIRTGETFQAWHSR
ncbi:CRISPR-associated endonuclease Cas1 [Vibrio gazogenes]|uniref:CRISPR-associated endonuclease Cas1 n=1 Tax=Vibrio gazogenes DSM 21264 = NBRC 103151 TaxID=1123492 RepID=A0A1M4VB00_VIBGA|nr:CRISPR-associated endonuclease Cas1 [Vibrio gazogenes]USP15583.1 CRISPR-associated endonuclease Cas1 [Vibrio gazogenes]SHE66146.1 CRISPR-associated endonuclease Cas1/group II intron reverse transcriptase/maturase,TIGR04416 [Vibrio gazogenes DSM 21264] [Vibrio gazogenes DSM 21264 = NBRC 103151]SJN57120.1 CRISPR-associated endonuclease Cas1 [Vibrio gazogenes]